HPREVISHNHDISGLEYDPIHERFLGLVSVAPPRETMLTSSTDLLNWTAPEFVLRPAGASDPTEFYGLSGVLARGDLLLAMVRVLRDDLDADPGLPPDSTG